MNRLAVRSPLGNLWSLQRTVDRLFDDALLRAGTQEEQGLQPALDMFETEDAVVVKATVPGFEPEDIDVSVTGQTLLIKGETSTEQAEQEHRYLFRERRLASFRREVSLPYEVGAEPSAQFEHGVLTLTLPKPQVSRSRVIQIQAK